MHAKHLLDFIDSVSTRTNNSPTFPIEAACAFNFDSKTNFEYAAFNLYIKEIFHSVFLSCNLILAMREKKMLFVNEK